MNRIKNIALSVLIAGILLVVIALSPNAAAAPLETASITRPDAKNSPAAKEANLQYSQENTGASPLWQIAPESASMKALPRAIYYPRAYQTYSLDETAFAALLQNAPHEFAGGAAGKVVPLPLPDGQMAQFHISQSPLMQPELAAKYPQIKTYKGWDAANPATTVRFTWSPYGLSVFISSPQGDAMILPYNGSYGTPLTRQDGRAVYISFYYKDLPQPPLIEKEHVEIGTLLPDGLNVGGQLPGDTLRVFRYAVTAQGGFSQAHGGTVPSTLSAIVAQVSNINVILERDLAARFVLVDDNDQLIYLDPETDPFTVLKGRVARTKPRVDC